METPNRHGYLYRQGTRWPYNWSKRYFKLNGYMLSYFKKDKDTEPLGQVVLKNAQITVISKEVMGKDFVFKIDVPPPAGAKDPVKPIFVHAYSYKEMEDWIAELQKSIMFAANSSNRVKSSDPFSVTMSHYKKIENGELQGRRQSRAVLPTTAGDRNSLSLAASVDKRSYLNFDNDDGQDIEDANL